MLRMSVQFFFINSRCTIPSFPPILCHHGPELHFHFFLLRLNRTQKGGKCMTDNLCPICSYNTWARTSHTGREREPQQTTQFCKKNNKKRKNRAEGQFQICLWLSLTNLQARSSWVVKAEKIYLDGWQLVQHSSGLPVSPQRAHVTALKATLSDNDIAGLVLSGIHFILEQFGGSAVWICTFVCQGVFSFFRPLHVYLDPH